MTVQNDVEALERGLAGCMIADRYRLAAQLRKFAQGGRLDEQRARKLGEAIRHSQAQLESRRAHMPVPEFGGSLPIEAKKDEIAAAVNDHQVVIVCGETGSGKTTQIPKICLELKRGAAGLIGCTQPRRLAARSVAARLAAELKVELGHAVGYKVRFTDRVSESTYLKVMTDGILLAEIESDRLLAAYDTIVVDEAHERSLNIDFLLGYVKRVLSRRPELRLIITSATIDADRFSRHFGGAPVIEVSGRLYPVEVRYRPRAEDPNADETRDMKSAILDAVDEVSRIGPTGDILVFLPGEREIRETAEALRKHHPPHTEILPLYARLSVAEQDRVFAPAVGRRIVLATNVAETSITVPGIRYVVDTGLARISRYSVQQGKSVADREHRARRGKTTGRALRPAGGRRLYSPVRRDRF